MVYFIKIDSVLCIQLASTLLTGSLETGVILSLKLWSSKLLVRRLVKLMYWRSKAMTETLILSYTSYILFHVDMIWKGWFLFFSLPRLHLLDEALLEPDNDVGEFCGVVPLVHSKMFRVPSSWS